MTDLPPDLSRLRILETWLALTLDRVRRQIADEERREAERRRGVQARPPAPAWLIERSLSRGTPPVYVHVGDCCMVGKRSKGVDRGEAVRALVDGIDACQHCRPDTALGILD
ncbi:DUF6233 domain-containing protein [Streptomyces sp. AC495_CC817]|uniref:DUF6233 domain-containing protein n=1 Tax=Streptomyces sp. AC495_CC817 TaxID=2823900 RepID=UPI001C25E359|nr:DUF6233 domain-containing protein [Streptomyces sp. AC495_CC817]